jgi:hypothetical protein
MRDPQRAILCALMGNKETFWLPCHYPFFNVQSSVAPILRAGLVNDVVTNDHELPVPVWFDSTGSSTSSLASGKMKYQSSHT